jgi:hypothetical protein
MSDWNYRIVHKKPLNGEDLFAIHEVFYSEDGEIENYTARPTYPIGETLEELTEEMEFYLKALQSPVLEQEDLEKKGM